MRSALIALVLVACGSGGPPGPGIAVDRALEHVRVLASAPRVGDTAAARDAAAYVEAQLPGRTRRLPVGTVDLPAITVLGSTFRAARTVTTTDPDLVVRLGPPGGKALLIMAHYDTVAGSPGAVDNAAAVAVLIELARVLLRDPPPQPVLLVFTANEEPGLVGAEALAAATGDDVAFAIALDLIGGSGPLSINGASKLIGATELRWLAEAADRAGVVLRAPLPHRAVSRWWPQAERSDHGPFTRRGIRAIHLYDRGQDGESIDRAYHGPRDTISRVDPRSLDELGRLLRALVRTPVPAHGGDGFWVPVLTNTVVPRWPVVAGCGALIVLALWLVFGLRGQRPVTGRLGLVAAIGCFGAAVAAVIVLERVASAGHPAAWLHAPLRWVIGEALVLAGGFGLATRVLARYVPGWGGLRRYLLVAVLVPLAIGAALLVIGAAELAWIWLVPAALAALAPRLGRFGIAAILPLALPGLLVLAPNQLREAAWNGFLPLGVPLGAWLATFSVPLFAGVGWYLRTRNHSGPLGTVILYMGGLLAIYVGLGLVLGATPACSPVQFHDFHLGCEALSGVR